MIPFRKSIGFRLLGISFILLALPLLVDSFILVQHRYEHSINDAKDYLVEIAQLRELPLSQIQPLNKPLIEVFANYLDLQENFPEKPSDELNEKLAKLAQVGNFYGLFVIKITEDNQYEVVASGLPQYIGKNYTDFFKLNNLYSPEALERGYDSYISYDNKTLQPYFVVAHAIYSLKEEKIVGVLAISDDISPKLKELLAPEQHRYTVNFALLLPSTIVFAASDPKLRFQYFLPLKSEYKKLFLEEEPFAAPFLAKEPLSTDDKIGFPFFEFTWQGKEQVGYIKRLSEANYALLAYASKDQIFQEPLVDFFHIYSVYGLILILGGLTAYLLTKRMAKPIQSLSLVMQKIQEKDLQLRYQKDPLGFEINVLGNIFNEMIDAVLEQKRVAEEERVKRELFAKELRVGQQVQRSLLPQTMPKYPGVDVAEMYIPAIEVGGDFYDVFVKDEKDSAKLVLAVADASGKGVQACFYSLSVRNMLRTYAKEYEDIAEAMSRTNTLFRKDTGDSGMFVTVLAGIYDYKTRSLNYFSCGHNPGLVRRENGKVEVLEHLGMAMGVVPYEKDICCQTVQLYKGDVVVFYSDGITEAHDVNYQFYGEQRLIECLKEEGYQSASDIAAEIVGSVNEFVGDAPQHDDITLLVMKIKDD